MCSSKNRRSVVRSLDQPLLVDDAHQHTCECLDEVGVVNGFLVKQLNCLASQIFLL